MALVLPRGKQRTRRPLHELFNLNLTSHNILEADDHQGVLCDSKCESKFYKMHSFLHALSTLAVLANLEALLIGHDSISPLRFPQSEVFFPSSRGIPLPSELSYLPF